MRLPWRNERVFNKQIPTQTSIGGARPQHRILKEVKLENILPELMYKAPSLASRGGR